MKHFSILLALLAVLLFPSTVHAENPAYEDTYAPILDNTLSLILDGTQAHPLQARETGIAEALSGYSPTFSLEKIGYTLQDLTGDAIPELILGSIDSWDGDTAVGRELYAVYTCQNGTPVLLLEGWARNRYSMLRDGSILNSGSAGAMYSIFGTYQLTQNGLECLDYFFTFEKDETFEEIGTYHNCTGEWDKTVSEEMDMPIDAFWRLYEDAEQQIFSLPLTPFTTYAMEKGAASSLIRARWVSDLPSMPTDFTTYRDTSSEYNAEILLTSIGTVTDVHLLSLEFQDFDESGNPNFASTIVYSQDTLDTPLLAVIPFGEVLPIYGISYVDDHGIDRKSVV